MAELFDIDQATKDFEPVRIKFRGVEHTLGGSVLSLLNASSIFTEDVMKDDDDDTSFTKRVFEFLRPTLRALSSTMGDVIDESDLTPAEEAALLRPVTAAISQLGRLSFRADEDGPDAGDDS
jgi:hypothetical protein